MNRLRDHSINVIIPGGEEAAIMHRSTTPAMTPRGLSKHHNTGCGYPPNIFDDIYELDETDDPDDDTTTLNSDEYPFGDEETILGAGKGEKKLLPEKVTARVERSMRQLDIPNNILAGINNGKTLEAFHGSIVTDSGESLGYMPHLPFQDCTCSACLSSNPTSAAENSARSTLDVDQLLAFFQTIFLSYMEGRKNHRKEAVYVGRVMPRGSDSSGDADNETGGWVQTIRVFGTHDGRYKPAQLLVDSQLTYGNFISLALASELMLDCESCTECWEGVDGSTITSHQRAHVHFAGSRDSPRLYDDDFYVIDTPSYDMVVGREWMDRHPLLVTPPRALPVRQLSSKEAIEKARRERAQRERELAAVQREPAGPERGEPQRTQQPTHGNGGR